MPLTELNRDLESIIAAAEKNSAEKQQEHNFHVALEHAGHASEKELASLAELSEPIDKLNKFVTGASVNFLISKNPALGQLPQEMKALTADHAAAVAFHKESLDWFRKSGPKATVEEIEAKKKAGEGMAKAFETRIHKIKELLKTVA